MKRRRSRCARLGVKRAQLLRASERLARRVLLVRKVRPVPAQVVGAAHERHAQKAHEPRARDLAAQSPRLRAQRAKRRRARRAKGRVLVLKVLVQEADRVPVLRDRKWPAIVALARPEEAGAQHRETRVRRSTIRSRHC